MKFSTVATPLLRFYLAIVITVVLLAVSLNQLYNLLSDKPSPSVDARLVLDTVQQLRQHQKPLSCALDASSSCEDALFVVYPPGYWQGVQDFPIGEVVPLRDAAGQVLLCSMERSGELLCINQLNWPQVEGWRLELAYVFYLLLLLALFVVSRNLFRDVTILRDSALSEIRHGKFPDFRLSSRSYLTPLAQSLKNMTSRIEQLNRFQAEMAETVCHDIKTPLARLKFISHLLKPEQIEQSRQQILANINEIEDNVYDYLRLAQNDYTEQGLSLQSVHVRSYCEQLIDHFQTNSEIPLQLHIADEVPEQLVVDRTLLSRALNNLLSNALRFAKQQVALDVRLQQAQICFCVSDDGPGWQGQQVQDDIEHHGLGLSIVRRVAEKHQGELQFATSVFGGACCRLLLPQQLADSAKSMSPS